MAPDLGPPLTVLLVGAAFLTAALSGTVGLGGGLSLLGVMAAVLPPGQVVPLHGAVQLASNLTRTAVFLPHVRWRIFLAFAAPASAGVAAAAGLWSGAALGWFRPGIGVFLLAFLAWRRRAPALRAPPLWTYAPLGLAAGFLTVFVGAVGPFVAPFFLREDLEKEQAVATLAVCQAWGHLLKLPAFLALGFDYRPHAGLMAALLAAVVLGTLAGRRLLERLSPRAFTLAFETVLAVLAVRLLLAGPL